MHIYNYMQYCIIYVHNSINYVHMYAYTYTHTCYRMSTSSLM